MLDVAFLSRVRVCFSTFDHAALSSAARSAARPVSPLPSDSDVPSPEDRQALGREDPSDEPAAFEDDLTVSRPLLPFRPPDRISRARSSRSARPSAGFRRTNLS